MNKEQFERETQYGVAASLAREMLDQGIITEREYKKIVSFFRRKYRPIIGALLESNL